MAADAPRVAPDPGVDPAGAIEHADPRIVRGGTDRRDLEAWLAAHADGVGIGWAAAAGRPLERELLGIALAGRRRDDVVPAVGRGERRSSGVVRAR